MKIELTAFEAANVMTALTMETLTCRAQLEDGTIPDRQIDSMTNYSKMIAEIAIRIGDLIEQEAEEPKM